MPLVTRFFFPPITKNRLYELFSCLCVFISLSFRLLFGRKRESEFLQVLLVLTRKDSEEEVPLAFFDSCDCLLLLRTGEDDDERRVGED